MSADNFSPIDNDERVYVSEHRADFSLCAQRLLYSGDPSLHILRRGLSSPSDLSKAYRNLREARSFNSSQDFVTRVSFSNGEMLVDLPEGILNLASDFSDVIRDDLLDTAQLYSEATMIREPFHFRPSTVIGEDTHIHHVTVLSISWGGAGLAVDKSGRQTAQLEEGDYGLLSPRMPHRSPFRSDSGRMVMFIAPPDKG